MRVKSRDGKAEQQRTPRQSERRGKLTGRRKTNYCKHRKGEASGNTARDADFELAERLFDARRPLGTGKQMDKRTSVAHGVKGDDTSRKSMRATGESPSNPARVGSGIRRNAESRADVGWEVGDAHSSVDRRRNAGAAKGH